MSDSINKIGADVAKALRELEKGTDALDVRRDAAQSKLRQVWDALERGEIVNGCTTKNAWAAFAKVDIRTCQYTLKGKRNRSAEVKKRSANHVVRDVTVHVIDKQTIAESDRADRKEEASPARCSSPANASFRRSLSIQMSSPTLR